MVIRQAEIWWADLDEEPTGSAPGFLRPIVVVQCDPINLSQIPTVVCVPLTSNLKWVDAPGNVLLKSRTTGLPRDSVANVSQIMTLDKTQLSECVGQISSASVQAIIDGVNTILGR
jgi:mRNA interferase MazF